MDRKNKPGQSKLPQRNHIGRVLFLFCLVVVCHSSSSAWPNQRRTSVSVVDFGNSNFSKPAAERLRPSLESERPIIRLSPEVTRAAARAVGYAGSRTLS